jgi:probable DNA repair protein
VLLRSPYLPDAQSQWPRRAALERKWLDEGRREITCHDAAAAMERADHPQAERVKRALAAHRFPRDASPKHWVDRWRAWLAAIGWPGDRPLSSAEQQTRDAFDEVLANFAAMAIVDERMRIVDAHSALRDLANQTVFQPESPAVPIQIVGLLEATGLSFDRLWIAGLAAHRWPRTPQPHPLLPLSWQRDHDVPRSSAARELRFARAATTMLLRGSPRVVVSYAQSADDEEPPRPSELIAARRPTAFVPRTGDARRVPYARQIHATRPPLEMVADHHAPSIAEGTRLHGGAHAIQAQADCPFQAIALHRLEVERWPAPPVGLTASERGKLVHAALANFWTDIRDSATLQALSETALSERIVSATASARQALKPERWHWVPSVIAAGETVRIAALLREWIDRYERTRPPFVVEASEQKVDLTLAGIAFRLRIDRVDRVNDGFAIIDYKTGVTAAPKAWFDPRPRSPQLGLYALARRQAAPESPTRAVAYAQLRAGELKANGVAADAAIWPALLPVEHTTLKTWTAFETWWETQLHALADELRCGVAPVAPREGVKTCRTCELWALCRVRSTALRDEEGGDG